VTCLAERRMLEILDAGGPGAKPRTPFMKRGDRVEIDMLDASGRSVFGKMAQEVV
jgi:fumarylacetoacetate (FAA) hydrolase